jgi:hypothetical protein
MLPPEILMAIQEGWTELDLSSRDLTELPEEIGLAVKLEELCLSDNRLTSLPAAIGQLAQLQILDLQNNRISELPPEIGNLANLRHLMLDDNRLKAIPPEIGKLTELRRLWLSRNQLTRLPPEIAKLTHLNDWDFSKKRLPPRFAFALTVESNPLIDPPPHIRGTSKIRAYFNEHPRSAPPAFRCQILMDLDSEVDIRGKLREAFPDIRWQEGDSSWEKVRVWGESGDAHIRVYRHESPGPFELMIRLPTADDDRFVAMRDRVLAALKATVNTGRR